MNEYDKSIWFDTFFFGSIFIFIVYHLALFILRKKEYSNLLFSIFCFLIILRSLATSQGFITRFFSFHFWEYAKKIGHTSLILIPALFLTFIIHQFKHQVNKYILYITYTLTLVIFMIIIATPFKFYVRLLYFNQTILLLFAFYVLYILVVSIIKKKQGALILIIGYITFLITGINDILYSIDLVHTGYYTSFGFFLFLSSNSLVLAMRFTKLFSKVEVLSEELKVYSSSLEDKVKERTLQLEKANNQKTNFFINLAHEIKTPLTIVSNFLDNDIKQRGLSLDLEIVRCNLDKLKRDMINFLDIEKLNRKQVFYNHSNIINLSRLLIHKIILFKDIASKKNIIIQSDVKEKIFTRIDPIAMDRIINNIIDNSIKFTDAYGTINVELQTGLHTIRLKIEDSGQGMSKEQIENIFLPYYQISHVKRNIQGMGIGLSIVKKIIDEVGGTLKVESETGEGTQFTISLKNYVLKEDDILSNNTKYSKPIDTLVDIKLKKENYLPQRKNIFFVEDNLYMLTYLQNYFMKKYNVFYSINGKMALDKIGLIPKPHIIISDIMMDKMDGYKFYEKLLKHEEYKNIPFIFLTAKSNTEDKLRGLGKGAVDFIYKPFSILELEAKIEAHMRIQSEQRKTNVKEVEKKVLNFLKNQIQDDDLEYYYFEKTCSEYKITNREKDVIKLLLQGLEYKEIGACLDLSINTIKVYISNIYRKFEVQNKVELINIISKHKKNYFT